MGVHGLWQLIKEGSETLVLQTLTVREGFEAKRDRLYVIGVDVSIWMRQLEHKLSTGHAQTGENPELRTFLFRLSALADYPVHLVFVADGPLRPNIKRGTRVKTAPPWLTDGMRNLVEAFGFGWIQAAGEAEAELAEMNALGCIDAVMTDDGDALLFGAKVVIRNCELKRGKKHAIDVYRANNIASKVKLSRPDLLLYALLVGCDYDSTGLDKCGDQTARGLLRYGIGQELFNILATYKHDDGQLRRGLEGWRNDVRASLRTDPLGYIGRTNRALADKVPSSFPNVDVLHCFLSPALLPASSYSTVLHPRPIDFVRLGALCELYFGWGNRPQLLQKCRNLFWSNEVVRML
ncbi:PIN domain-like protein, partial [Ganoderma leucocontextum]